MKKNKYLIYYYKRKNEELKVKTQFAENVEMAKKLFLYNNNIYTIQKVVKIK